MMLHGLFRWPYGLGSALLAVPCVWMLLLLALYVAEVWAGWPGEGLRPLVLSLGAVASFLPLLLVLAGRFTPAPVASSSLAGGRSARLDEAEESDAWLSKYGRSGGGTAVPVEDYDVFCEGDFEPYLGKHIRYLTYKSRRFIVFLDSRLSVEWACAGHFELTPEIGRVLNRVAELTALPIDHLAFQVRFAFRALVAEAIARVLRDQPGVSGATADKDRAKADAEASQDALDKALNFYTARSTEQARWWYLSASVVTSLVTLLTVLCLWMLRTWVEALIGTPAFEVICGAGAGAAGALLSVLVGSRQHTPNSATQQRIHWFEGAARILAGSMGAVLVALAIKGNLVLGEVQSANAKELFFFLCMVAGWSERLVPSLIERFESLQAPTNVGTR